MALVEKWTRGDVYLEPIEHVYIHKKTERKYTSVTKVLHSIEPYFDTDAMAAKIAKKKDTDPSKKPEYHGLSKEQILEYWQYLNDTANEYGTKLHESIENYLLSQKYWYKPKDELERDAIKAYEALKLDEGSTMYPERIMFSEEYEIAGTSDLIIDIVDEYSGKIYFDVADFKTNKEFNFFSKFGKYFNKPLEYLPACQFTTYSLQLSIYAYLYQLEFPNKIWRQSYLLYWDKEAKSFQKINTVYMKEQAKKVLEYYKHSKLI